MMPASPLEHLPQDLLFVITKQLNNTVRIALTLASKIMAHKIEGIQQPRVANITKTCERGRFPYYRLMVNGNRRIVQRMLGEKEYRYCDRCKKFRPIDEQFWRDLFEYGKLEIAARGNKKFLKSGAEYEYRPADPEERERKIKGRFRSWARSLAYWEHDVGNYSAYRECPAHLFAKKRVWVKGNF